MSLSLSHSFFSSFFTQAWSPSPTKGLRPSTTITRRQIRKIISWNLHGRSFTISLAAGCLKRVGSLVNINIQARFRGNQSSISPASYTFVLPMPRGAKSNQRLLRSSPEIFQSAAAPNSCFCAFLDKPKIIWRNQHRKWVRLVEMYEMVPNSAPFAVMPVNGGQISQLFDPIDKFQKNRLPGIVSTCQIHSRHWIYETEFQKVEIDDSKFRRLIWNDVLNANRNHPSQPDVVERFR